MVIGILVLIILVVNIWQNEYTYYNRRLNEMMKDQRINKLDGQVIHDIIQKNALTVSIMRMVSLIIKVTGILIILVGIGISYTIESMPLLLQTGALASSLLAGGHITIWQHKRQEIARELNNSLTHCTRETDIDELINFVESQELQQQLHEHLTYAKVDAYRVGAVLANERPQILLKEMLFEWIPLAFWLFVILYFTLQVIK